MDAGGSRKDAGGSRKDAGRSRTDAGGSRMNPGASRMSSSMSRVRSGAFQMRRVPVMLSCFRRRARVGLFLDSALGVGVDRGRVMRDLLG